MLKQIYGEVSHSTFVSKFHSKAWLTDKKTKDWTKELKPLFTLYSSIKKEQIEKSLNTLIINNLESHVDDAVDQLPLSDDDRTKILADAQHILNNQFKVNNLCGTIASHLRSEATVTYPIESETDYIDWDGKKIEKPHLDKVTKKLNDMKEIHKYLLGLITKEFPKIKPQKDTFKKDTEIFLETCFKVDQFKSTPVSRLVNVLLKGKLHQMKKIQSELLQILKNIESVLNEYEHQRKVWVNFLMALRNDIEPCTLKLNI